MDSGKKEIGKKEVARILRSLDQDGQLVAALASLVKGAASGHLAVTDGKGKLEILPLPDFPVDPEKISQRRKAQLEALRRGIQLDDDGLWIEKAPFSEVFVEHDPFNEDPPFLEGPLIPGQTGQDDPFVEGPWNENPPWVELAPFDEMFVERANFLEATPDGTFTSGGLLDDLTPFNEDPPFIEGPFNEDPPFVELVKDTRGLTKTLRWKVQNETPLRPGELDRMQDTLNRTSLVQTFERIKKKIDRP